MGPTALRGLYVTFHVLHSKIYRDLSHLFDLFFIFDSRQTSVLVTSISGYNRCHYLISGFSKSHHLFHFLGEPLQLFLRALQLFQLFYLIQSHMCEALEWSGDVEC